MVCLNAIEIPTLNPIKSPQSVITLKLTPPAGAIIISTPQDIALRDAVKGINMFRTVKVPLLGMIQNMSLFTCPHCQQSTHIFSPRSGGVAKACSEHQIEFLGDIPLHASICEDADRGKPTVVSEPESERAKVFMQIAERVGKKIDIF